MLFFLKKLVTFCIVPPGIVIILLIVTAFLIKKRWKILNIILALVLYSISIELVKDMFIIPLEDAYKVPPVEAIKNYDAYVVLGGGINENAPDLNGEGQLSSESLPRVVDAYRLYKMERKPIILSGGRVYGEKPEAQIAKKFLISLGVNEKDIITEENSRDTYENALLVKEILEKKGLNRIILISSAFHMKRSVQLFKKHFSHILPYPTGYRASRSNYNVLSYMPNGENIAFVAYSIKEYMGIMYYTLKF
ncbi:MAG TPA: YdcF family protein [Syntrophorhabdaceae bacterium]|nr:YdcF family protein [Syntrophorhabdaceae bacterium]